MKYQAAIFDLDGTILNTLTDLKNALNYALAETGHSCRLSEAEAGACFGSASKVAAVRALCIEAGRPLSALEAVGTPGDGTVAALEPEAERVLAVFKDYYPTHCAIETRPYPGVLELLAELRGLGLKTAVVSNKLDAAVQTLCKVHFPGLIDITLGEQKGFLRRKPAPDMTNAVLRQFGITGAGAVYIGDTEVDLETAANAGMRCVTVSWGFRPRAFLQAHGAERIVDSTEELLKLLTAC